ncbi:MAG: precorrin-6A/cobalt-precorrin-6A reductase, partial [Verrucomicrobiales bacterium]
AARKAFEYGHTVLLTTGSRNLADYAAEARRTGVRWLARVLDHPDSLSACAAAGLEGDRIILGRGPFSIADNRRVIQQHQIGVLVTKDSGAAGGVAEKLAAARLENCRVVIVGRPEVATPGHATLAGLLAELKTISTLTNITTPS